MIIWLGKIKIKNKTWFKFFFISLVTKNKELSAFSINFNAFYLFVFSWNIAANRKQKFNLEKGCISEMKFFWKLIFSCATHCCLLFARICSEKKVWFRTCKNEIMVIIQFLGNNGILLEIVIWYRMAKMYTYRVLLREINQLKFHSEYSKVTIYILKPRSVRNKLL